VRSKATRSRLILLLLVVLLKLIVQEHILIIYHILVYHHWILLTIHLFQENAFVVVEEAVIAFGLEQVLVHHIVYARWRIILLTRLLRRFLMLILTHCWILVLAFNGAVDQHLFVILDDSLDLWVHLLLELLLIHSDVIIDIWVLAHFSQFHWVNGHTIWDICIILHICIVSLLLIWYLITLCICSIQNLLLRLLVGHITIILLRHWLVFVRLFLFPNGSDNYLLVFEKTIWSDTGL